MSKIKDMGNNKRIIQEWMVRENNRLKEEGIINTAREDGMKKGIEQGTNKRNIEIISNMLKEGSDYNFISKVTGKTVNEIKKIESNLVNAC